MSQLYVLNRGVALYGGRVLTSGSIWGQDMLLSCPALRSRASAKALSYLETQKIGRESLFSIAELFPRTRKVLRKYTGFLALRRQVVIMAQIEIAMRAEQGAKCSHGMKLFFSDMPDEETNAINVKKRQRYQVLLDKLGNSKALVKFFSSIDEGSRAASPNLGATSAAAAATKVAHMREACDGYIRSEETTGNLARGNSAKMTAIERAAAKGGSSASVNGVANGESGVRSHRGEVDEQGSALIHAAPAPVYGASGRRRRVHTKSKAGGGTAGTTSPSCGGVIALPAVDHREALDSLRSEMQGMMWTLRQAIRTDLVQALSGQPLPLAHNGDAGDALSNPRLTPDTAETISNLSA